MMLTTGFNLFKEDMKLQSGVEFNVTMGWECHQIDTTLYNIIM